jgi:arylamine N-acetyltransferase
MIKAGTKFNFDVRTARKNAHFQLAHTGDFTVIEDVRTKKELMDELAEMFLEEINKPLEGAEKYKREEVRVKLSAVA